MPYHRMKLYVGIFVTLLGLSVVSLFYIIMDKKGYFDDYATFYFKTNNATFFFVGMPVNYSGFEIGTITKLELTPEGEVKVDFKVKESDHKWICRGTFLMLEKPLIGIPTISVKTSLGNPKEKNGSELKIIIRDDINDVILNIQPTLTELQQVIHSVNLLTANLASKEGSFEKSMDNMERFSAKLANDQGLLTTVTGDPVAAKALTASLVQSKQIITDVHSLSIEISDLLKSLQHQVIAPTGQSMKTANEIFVDIKRKLDTLDKAVTVLGSSDKDLMLLKKELHINLDKTHQLLEKVDAVMMDKHDSTVVLP